MSCNLIRDRTLHLHAPDLMKITLLILVISFRMILMTVVHYVMHLLGDGYHSFTHFDSLLDNYFFDSKQFQMFWS